MAAAVPSTSTAVDDAALRTESGGAGRRVRREESGAGKSGRLVAGT